MRTLKAIWNKLRRTTPPLILSAAVALALIGSPATASAQGDTAAVAINTKDGSAIFRLAFNVRRTMKDVVDQSNAAVAFASCEACRTVAVSIQLVLVMSDPNVVTPTNLALAVNQECTSCETLASAYQYVLGTGGPVHFDAEGNRELAAIRHEFRDLVKRSEDMEVAEIQGEVDGLVERLELVVDGHLVASGRARDVDGGANGQETTATEGEAARTEAEITPTPAQEQSVDPSSEPSIEPPPEEDSAPSPSSTPPESSTPNPESTETP
jgi:putative peptide zinc metalloprotease protein